MKIHNVFISTFRFKKMKKAVIISTIIIVISLGTLFYFYYFNNPNYSELNCQTLIESGIPEENINIVFFTDGIGKEELNTYINEILSTPPFSENKEKFNFYYINTQIECELKYSAILCYSRELIKKSSACPNDFIAVISKKDPSIRSSAYLNVMSINSALAPTVIVHEFGHVFANLADEYIPANIPFGSKNCKSNCENFNGIGNCFQGCSESDYSRSSYASIMRTLKSNSFEEFNEELINQKIQEYK